MKKGLVFYLVAIGLAINLLVLGCANSTSGNTDDGTLETTCDDIVVCFGNSLTAGYGATTPGKDDTTKAYPAYLQDKINIQVINAGKSGDTTSGALSRVKTDVLSKNPKIVIIVTLHVIWQKCTYKLAKTAFLTLFYRVFSGFSMRV